VHSFRMVVVLMSFVRCRILSTTAVRLHTTRSSSISLCLHHRHHFPPRQTPPLFDISLVYSNSFMPIRFDHHPVRLCFPRPMVPMVSHLRSNWWLDREKGFDLSACCSVRSDSCRSWYKFYVLLGTVK
jgi:hypothetical protein